MSNLVVHNIETGV